MRRESENLQGKEATLTHTLTQTGTQGARVQYYDWAGCAVLRTCLRMGARGARVKNYGWAGCSVKSADLSEDGSKGRAQGAPSDLKMPLEKERAEEERVSRGQASERAVCV